MPIEAVSTNKKAYHEYFIEETFEAGIVLTGSEVKSLRLKRLNLNDSYARVIGNEVFLINAHVSPYAKADGFTNAEPERTRKLLLHKREITRLIGKVREKGYTLIPIKIYFNNRGIAKVTLGLAKGKTLYDKRETLRKRDAQKEVQRAFKTRKQR